MCWLYHIRTMEKHHESLHSPQGHLTHNTSCEGCLCPHLCVSACVCVCVSPWVVIFTQPYGVTAQIINYSSLRERDSKRGSLTIPDTKVGARKFVFIVGYGYTETEGLALWAAAVHVYADNIMSEFCVSLNSESFWAWQTINAKAVITLLQIYL